MGKGWLKIQRSLLNSEEWVSEVFSRPQAWIDLLFLTNYKDGSIRVSGQIIPIKRGQCGYSVLTLSKRWKWSRGKTQKYLDELQHIEHRIEQLKSNRTTVISILNYDKYQSLTKEEMTPDYTPSVNPDNTTEYTTEKHLTEQLIEQQNDTIEEREEREEYNTSSPSKDDDEDKKTREAFYHSSSSSSLKFLEFGKEFLESVDVSSKKTWKKILLLYSHMRLSSNGKYPKKSDVTNYARKTSINMKAEDRLSSDDFEEIVEVTLDWFIEQIPKEQHLENIRNGTFDYKPPTVNETQIEIEVKKLATEMAKEEFGESVGDNTINSFLGRAREKLKAKEATV